MRGVRARRPVGDSPARLASFHDNVDVTIGLRTRLAVVTACCVLGQREQRARSFATLEMAIIR